MSVFRAARSPHISIDPNGNLTQKVDGTTTWTYEWNAENQLTRILSNGSEAARYKYDPLERRVEKVAGATTTSWTYDGEDILRESQGSTALRFIHANGTDQVLAKESGAGALTYFHADALGSIVRTTDSSGAVVTSYSYDAFGEMSGGAAGYSYTGREWDADSQLHYYRARYYDPKVGRFIGEDPLRWAGGLNLYAYAQNAPTLFKDPSGLSPDSTDDNTCLTCLLYAEARGQSSACQVAVLSVVMNRLSSKRARNPSTPTSVCDIIKEPYEFDGWRGGQNPNYNECVTCSVKPQNAPDFLPILARCVSTIVRQPLLAFSEPARGPWPARAA